MNLKQSILVCSSDPDPIRNITAAVADNLSVVTAVTWAEVDERMMMHAPAVAIVDVRCTEIYQRLDEWHDHHRDVPVIAMGTPKSDPVLSLRQVDLFAFADPAYTYREWQQVIGLAIKHHRLQAQVHELKGQVIDAAAVKPVEQTPAPAPNSGDSIIAHVAGAFRHFEHVDLMLDRAIEGLSTAAHTTRAGLFALDENAGRYRFRAGQRYMKETAEAEYEPHDPLVRWFERHAHMITRTMAMQLPDAGEKKLLLRTLDLTGADIIAPLHARGKLLGWVFLGCRSTGQPYELRDLEELSMATDYLSMLLENALLYNEVTVQKSLAETLLHSLPTGIVAVDGGGVIRWFSTAAEDMLGKKDKAVTGKPIEVLGSRLADAVRRAMKGEATPNEKPWEEAATHKFLRLETRSLGGEDNAFGAVLLIQDLTAVRQIQEKQEQLERAAFWTDLAAGLSHEIRNPLVTIRTFAQLLPERYQDDEFREEFSKLVTQEVDRLGGIIDQINDFAHPPEPQRHKADVRVLLQKAFKQVFDQPDEKSVNIKSEFDGNLPLVEADEKALTDCFAHLIKNCIESMDESDNPVISCSAHARNGDASDKGVEISITDNGRGIPQEVLDKVFSPFYTTKARGMGLGLPIVKRTVVDHNGRVDIDSSGKGTSVVIHLPVDEERLRGDAS